MSDGILCAVSNCSLEAEIEVERKGATLWLCADHYKDFITRREPTGTPLLLTDAEVARLLSISRATVWRMVSEEQIPLPTKLRGSARWRPAVIEKWVEANCPPNAAL